MATDPNFKIPSPMPSKRAWSDAKDHIVVKHGDSNNSEYGYDTQNAIKLLRDLEQAIRDSI